MPPKKPNLLSIATDLQHYLQLTDLEFLKYLGVHPEQWRQFKNGTREPPTQLVVPLLHHAGYIKVSRAVLMAFPASARRKLEAWQRRHAHRLAQLNIRPDTE
jgi:hypothetical protein